MDGRARCCPRRTADNFFVLPSRKPYVDLYPVLLRQTEHFYSFPARIMLRRGDKAGAHAVMTKIYAFAKPEEVDLKVRYISFAEIKD